MARIAPFHSSGKQPLKVHHDDDTCPNGLSIVDKNRVAGDRWAPEVRVLS